ncbi:hypothetical protein ACFSKU_05145 [Pontibacter silvestris]|uniref:Cardiolipin synthase N-terminal domain-containing protein n=1 Tax=Pontibacter silvestris TaxID=2305183 RepID=A0ABW4WW91_9BACT|nr:hypothetical protein [Pontibacter silvestris]MCC9136923.1 hypothetical protein [Pontibacter silvestris]
MEEAGEVFLGLGIVGLIIGLIGLLLYIWSIIWAYNDAQKRRRPGILVAIMVAFLAWPIGLVLWLIIRPDYYNPAP